MTNLSSTPDVRALTPQSTPRVRARVLTGLMVLVGAAALHTGIGCASTSDGATKPQTQSAADSVDDKDRKTSDTDAKLRIERLVHVSGLESKLLASSRVGMFFVEGVKRQSHRLPEDDVDARTSLQLVLAIAEHSAAPAYDLEMLRADLIAALTSLPRPVVDAVIAHSESARTDRTAVLLADLGTPVGQQRLARFLGKVRAGEIDEERMLLAEATLAGAREVEFSVALAFDASTSFLRALDAALPANMREGEQHIAARRAAFLESAQRQLTMQTLYVFTNLEIDDVRAEAQFFASPEGRAFASARIDAVKYALKNAEARAQKAVNAAVAEAKSNAKPPTDNNDDGDGNHKDAPKPSPTPSDPASMQL